MKDFRNFLRYCEKWKAYDISNLFKYWRKFGINKTFLKKMPEDIKKDENCVAVLGSVGKTTIVRMLAELLNNTGYKTFRTKINDNWLPQIPIAGYLSLKSKYFARIFECGARKKGDIGAMSFLIPANFVIFTEFTNTHLEELGDFKGVVKEKMSFIGSSYKGHIISHVNNSKFLDTKFDRVIYYGPKNKKSDYYFTNVKNSFSETSFILNRKNGTKLKVKIGGIGYHLAVEATGAICAFEKITGRLVTKKNLKILEEFRNPARRMEIVKRIGSEFILDSANANRLSILNSFRSFLAIRSGKPKGIVLDSLSGMGKALNSEIKHITSEILKLPLDNLRFVYLIDKNFSFLYSRLKKRLPKAEILIYDDLKDSLKRIDLDKIRGSLVLLRGPGRAKNNLARLVPNYRNYSDETRHIKR